MHRPIIPKPMFTVANLTLLLHSLPQPRATPPEPQATSAPKANTKSPFHIPEPFIQSTEVGSSKPNLTLPLIHIVWGYTIPAIPDTSSRRQQPHFSFFFLIGATATNLENSPTNVIKYRELPKEIVNTFSHTSLSITSPTLVALANLEERETFWCFPFKQSVHLYVFPIGQERYKPRTEP